MRDFLVSLSGDQPDVEIRFSPLSTWRIERALGGLLMRRLASK